VREWVRPRIDALRPARHREGVSLPVTTDVRPEAIVHYLVDSPDGPVGVVDSWVPDAAAPSALVVAQGWFGQRRLVLPVDAILGVDHANRRVLVGRGAAPLERRGLVGRLLGRDGRSPSASP
jgi:hypothetical protein